VSSRLPFRSDCAWDPTPVPTLIVCCSDGRFAAATDELGYSGQGWPRFNRFQVPGGPAWLTRRPELAPERRAAFRHLELLVAAHRIERIVLVSHAGCAFYAHLLRRPAEACVAEQRADLLEAAESLRTWFPQAEVAAYLAQEADGRIAFEPVGG